MPISAVILESQILDTSIANILNKINDKPILLLENKIDGKKYSYNEKLLLPTSFIDLNNKITNVIIGFKFLSNSKIKIKKYILDKNEKKLIKNNNFIFITEREIQLIELLFNQKKSLTKNYILKKIWNYSDNADTHTVETHIHRLRKKIYSKFNDNRFILNFEKGYII